MTAQTSPRSAGLTLQTERPGDGARISALLDQAFGPGRFVKVSERVREMAPLVAAYSFCAFEDGRLVGSVRQSKVRVGDDPVVFLGPLAVEAGERKGGVGGQLVEAACEAAKTGGEKAVLLVGDEAYFGRFGFTAAAAADIRLPGPVDQRRVLLRRLSGDAAYAGLVQAP